MLFSVPIKKITQPNYNEGSALRSVRDSDNNSKVWKKSRTVKSQGLSDNIGLAQVVQRLNKLQRRQVGYQAQDSFFPFKIYKIGNVSATQAQRDAYAAVNANINDYTYQVRSGMVGWRSKYSLDGVNVQLNNTFEYTTPCLCTDNLFSNFSQQPTANTGSTVVLDNFSDVLIPTNCQVALNPTQDGLNSISASFYIKVTDDPVNGVSAQLYGRMYTDDIGSGIRQYGALPSYTDSSIILLGTLEGNLLAYGFIAGSIMQYQWGNLVNRYVTQAPLGNVLGPSNVQRGKWTADSLSGQVFYFGDIVIDDTTPVFSSAGTNFYGVYTYNGVSTPSNYVKPITASPTVDGSFWTMTGTVIL